MGRMRAKRRERKSQKQKKKGMGEDDLLEISVFCFFLLNQQSPKNLLEARKKSKKACFVWLVL